MSGDSFDDDFGGFETAPTRSSSNLAFSNSTKQPIESKLPDWLLNQPPTTPNKVPNNTNDLARQLQLQSDELSQTKEQLLDQQTRYLQMQTKHSKEIDDTTNNFNNAVQKFQTMIKQSMAQQRDTLTKEFKVLIDQQASEYELKMKREIRELQVRQANELDIRVGNRFAEFQERMIVKCESDLQDLDVKIRKIVSGTIKEENLVEKAKLKQNFDAIEREMKGNTEKYVQTYFKGQSENFKEQIKSGVQQEHLIHKDLINSKLEKLFRSSEEKRRGTNLLLNRHMSGLSFFIDNAHKQIGILNQAQKDLVNNREITDYYGDINNNPSGVSVVGGISSKDSYGPMKNMEDVKVEELFNDECLLEDLWNA